jgi:isopentenyl-diphosphate Delta-isomerase
MNNDVVLVNEKDEVIGQAEKLKAHQEGLLHRAISILVFNSAGKLLLQQRALEKYHSGGLWTNTCCSHPAPDESLEQAVHRRLQFEMGFDCVLNHHFSFLYRASFENGLIEHEFDHVFVGQYDAPPQPNPEEVADFAWVTLPELYADMAQRPDRYTPWFHLIMVEWQKHTA